MDAFVGKWKLMTSENFDEYMKAIDVPLITRKAAVALKPKLIIKVEGDTIELTLESTFKTTVIKFKLGEEFDETTGDGRDVKSIMTLEETEGKPPKLVHVQKWEGKETSLVREVTGDKLKLTLTFGKVESIRHYEKC
ncbi:hypothetical protein COCON_G00133240 [Conger conger]|uniref:Cytosolic fatty-acid binding proteins domain-containing protein n=1 Tax=Conger conger TaxID=82655 RepID=A0A9Q1HXI7_CONCO|nr:fatty acid-binding protein, heart [Conger conger]KAJ8268152.1 hypothetical protein COCON_G00133240 [Conger conger]